MLARTCQVARQAVIPKKNVKSSHTPSVLKSTFFDANQAPTFDAATFDAKSYLKSSHFNALSHVDQSSLKNHLLTPVGTHAITSGYITISEFLTLTISIRETLNRLFNPSYVTDTDTHKLMIDEIFKKNHLNIDELKDISITNREMLVRLIVNKNGLKLLDDGFLNKDDYLHRLSSEEQTEVLGVLKKFDSSHLECDYQAMIDAVRKKISAHTKSL